MNGFVAMEGDVLYAIGILHSISYGSITVVQRLYISQQKAERGDPLCSKRGKEGSD